ncbi:WD40/YVTN/BNR-like repeat-containing protein [Pseudoduganella sp. UC29_106]|uniref:WD40/YVTN/BNR-like repeat-containing protein n=1 Tax=Pseudoduganella sp. UC29_106 TaxID=3374553 RepID=UPI003756D6C5
MNKSSSLNTVNLGQPKGKPRLAGFVVSALPWLIISGLLYAGLFVKPRPVGGSVTPPILEHRDRVYGIAHGENGTLLAAASNGKIFAIGKDGSITRQPTPVFLSLQDIAAFDGTRAVAVGNDNTVLYTEDGGKHWIQSGNVPRSAVANKLNRLRAGANGVAVAVGEMGALLLTPDYGKTWQRLRKEEDVAWNDVAILDANNLLVAGEFGRMLRSANGGKDWIEEQAPVKGSLMALAFRDTVNGVAVGLDGVVLTSSDGGRKWVKADTGIHDHLLDVLWNADKKEWFAVGVMGRWVSGAPAGEGVDWSSGVLGEHTLSWHTRALAAGPVYWLSGADIGTWDGKQWSPLTSR